MNKNVHPVFFETRKPVSDLGFHDRTKLMEQLESLVKAHFEGRPSWVALLGPRKIGKTSILAELQRRAQTHGVVVTLDLFNVDARVQDVLTALLRSLLIGVCEQADHHELAGKLGGQAPPLSAKLAHELSTELPFGTVGKALELLEAVGKTQVSNAEVTEVLELPERMAQELGPVWLIIDELQELEALNRQRPFNKRHTIFRLMRSVWQRHELVSYWATGSQVSMLSSVFNDRRSPFHGHFRLVHVGPFELETAAQMLLDRTSISARADDAALAAEVAAETLGGHPFYIQVLGEELELRQVKLSRHSVKSVLQDILLEPTGRLALHLTGILEADAGSGQQVAVLRALAKGEARLSELVLANRSLSKDATHTILRRLQAADLVVHDLKTQRWRVADPALAAVLRTGGLTGEPSPSVLGDEGERAAARHLLTQGLRPVYQSYRSLGPADLVVLEADRRLALQVKRSPLPLYIKETEYQRLKQWANKYSMKPVLCQVEPEEPTTVRYWRWSSGVKTSKRRRFDENNSATSVLALLNNKHKP